MNESSVLLFAYAIELEEFLNLNSDGVPLVVVGHHRHRWSILCACACCVDWYDRHVNARITVLQIQFRIYVNNMIINHSYLLETRLLSQWRLDILAPVDSMPSDTKYFCQCLLDRTVWTIWFFFIKWMPGGNSICDNCIVCLKNS